MLDKIMLKNKHEASLIFTDRSPVRISSDVDVVPILLWFLGDTNAIPIPTGDGIAIELRRDTADEITVKIELNKVA